MRLGIGGGNGFLRGGASVGRGGVRGGVGVGPFSVSGSGGGRSSSNDADAFFGVIGLCAASAICYALYVLVVAGLTFLGVVFVLVLSLLWIGLVVLAPFLAVMAVRTAVGSSLTSLHMVRFGALTGIDVLDGKDDSYLSWKRWFKSAALVLFLSVLASAGVGWLSGRLEQVFEKCDSLEPVARDCMVPWDVIINSPGFWSKSMEYISGLRIVMGVAIGLVLLLFLFFLHIERRMKSPKHMGSRQEPVVKKVMLEKLEQELRTELLDYLELNQSTRVTKSLLQQAVVTAYWRGFSNSEIRRLLRLATDLEILRDLKRDSDARQDLLSRRTRRALAI